MIIIIEHILSNTYYLIDKMTKKQIHSVKKIVINIKKQIDSKVL